MSGQAGSTWVVPLTTVALTLALAGMLWHEIPRGRGQGVVLSTLNRPVPGAEVTLSAPARQGHKAYWRTVRTDRDGRFALANLPTGRYQIMVQHKLTRGRGQLEVREAQSASVTLRVRPPAPGKRPWHRPPDPAAVARRTEDIVRARFQLTRPLMDVVRANNRSGLPLAVVLAQAGAESSFRPRLDGALDEIGLFQLRPATARDQEAGPFPNAILAHPDTNTRLATRHLSRLMVLFKNPRTALGAYNQGEGKTQREGLYPIAQMYADAILRASRDRRFRERLHQLDGRMPAP